MSQLKLHGNYQGVRNAAIESHQNQRKIEGISNEIILLARLYTYGFRGQAIGTFHATAKTLEKIEKSDANGEELQRAEEDLRALGALSVELVPTDYRAVLVNFYRYDQGITRVLESLTIAGKEMSSDELRNIRAKFITAIECVTNSSGIFITRDDEIPEQASFVVPSLGITIVPLVYGDQHSWNMAFLSGENLDVPRHLHREGIEIHLGMGSLHGETCLGGYRAEVTEGYAMPIPPGTPHGYINRARHQHRLPFIFGSRRLGGWGIIPDVNPQPIEASDLKSVSVESKEMNGTVLLDREIAAAAKASGNSRRTLISGERTFSPLAGGISLSISRVETEMIFEPAQYQIVSVARGNGKVIIGSSEASLSPHAHFGIPAGARASISAFGPDPLILLDAVLIEKLS
jgi:mannose-6-phosphate isomerase-like protein (cupin superfamily)